MRTVAYCGDHTALTTTRFGTKIYVDTRDTSLAPHIMLDGDWESWVTNFLKDKLFQQNAVFVDVGANVGWYTLFACAAGCEHVFAIEPQEHLTRLLKKSLSVNGYSKRCTVIRSALGDHNGYVPFKSNPEEAGGASVIESARIGDSPCPITRLKDIVSADAVQGRQLFIKSDTEGYEPPVLRGAEMLIKDHSPRLILEHQQGADYKDMYNWLWDLGYNFRHIRRNGFPSALLALDDLMKLPSAETVWCEREVKS